MPKRSRKPHQGDVNQTAADVVRIATETEEAQPAAARKKNPAAVALGRLGGKKGGKARAAKLSPDQRREIAKKAAAKRWKKSPGTE